ncbi:MAG: carboxypeptidase regulatory-like domain-containing protein [Acidobacteria bacterium]|nr:carboxypeptidase regulatory-like domain-containing protein [Acidobacteriota bacterium]
MKHGIYALGLALVCAVIGFLYLPGTAVVAQNEKQSEPGIFAEQKLPSKRVFPDVVAVDTLDEMLRRDALAPKPDMEYILKSKGKRPRNPPAEEMPPVPESLFERNPRMFFDHSKITAENPLVPQVASPSPNLDFQGIGDTNTSIPPDTNGAVGPNHIMTALNTQVRIQSKTGATVSTVTLNSFFASVGGGGGTFDPRVLFDPYQDRWICVAVDDAAVATSKILIAVSQTNDPTGTWNFWGYDHDGANVEWADYPMVGFNKNWIAVSINDFTVAGNAFSGANCYIFDKSTLYAAAPTPTVSKADLGTSLGNVHQPVETFDNSINSLYVIQRWNSAGGSLRIYEITGTAASPTLTATGLFPTSTGWSTTAVSAPQNGGAVTITNNDSRLQRAVYRNGSVWAAHTIFLTSPSRTSAQWWQFKPTDGTVQQMGRIDDASGSNSYAFPSIAVNAAGQALVGYSAFSSTTFASAAYSYRGITDATATTRDPVRYKNGIACYRKTFGGGTNRWGDYSNTVVDPTDDMTFWTLQEYAEAAVGGDCSADNTGRWAVWWAKVIPPCSSVVTSGNWNAAATWGCGSVPTASDDAVVAKNQTVTLNVDPSAATIVVNSGGTLAVSGNRTLSSNLLVNGTLNLAGGILDSGSATITIGCGGSISNASATGYVRGNLRKEYCATGSFAYSVGSANGYSPVNATVTALGANPSSLTISTTQSAHPQLASSNSLARYWTLTESGDVTVDLVFNYLQSDVVGVESGYQLYRITGGTASAVTPFTLDTTANTLSVAGVTAFSDWSGGSLSPTAASVSVRGRVSDSNGAPIPRISVTLTDANGQSRRAISNAFGNYEFSGVPVGGGYVLTVVGKGYEFNPQVLNVDQDTIVNPVAN